MSEQTDGNSHWLQTSQVSVGRYFAFSSAALIVIFAWMEPAGASGIGFLRGLAFWTVQIAILIPLLITVSGLCAHFAKPLTLKGAWLQTGLAGLLAALLFVPIAFSLDQIFAVPEDSPSESLIEGLLDEASGVVVPVTITWLALNAPWILKLDFSSASKSETKELENSELEIEEAGALSSPFLEELKKRTKGELISISSELHYLRVTTSESEVMFLYNLKDAIEELPKDLGIQIHRSHWVALKQIKETKKIEGKGFCLLSNDATLPISRRKYSEVLERTKSKGV